MNVHNPNNVINYFTYYIRARRTSPSLTLARGLIVKVVIDDDRDRVLCWRVGDPGASASEAAVVRRWLLTALRHPSTDTSAFYHVDIAPARAPLRKGGEAVGYALTWAQISAQPALIPPDDEEVAL